MLLKFFYTIFFLILFTSLSLSQTNKNGILKGKVIDEVTQNAVEDAIIDLINTGNKTRTDSIGEFNFENYGGTPVLGVAHPVIIGHGISHAKAFKNMIKVAVRMIDADLLGKMKKAFKTYEL